MLGIAFLQEPWLDFAQKIGGTGFAIICLALALVCLITWHAAVIFVKFGGVEKGLVEVRQQMITRDSFALALSEMEKRLNNWANDRFLLREECLPSCELCGNPPRRRQTDRS